jgi:predicted DNA-binding antitoxin AbrB/MazE fold protein
VKEVKVMLTTIKGIYEDGVIRPLEEVNIKGKAEVIIIFLNTTKKRDTFLSVAGSWKDIDTETLKKQIYENRKISIRRKVKL